MRVMQKERPFPSQEGAHVFQIGYWPASWIMLPQAVRLPFVAAYRLRFSMPEAAIVRAHVSADERYELFLDGQRVGRGPERGGQETRVSLAP